MSHISPSLSPQRAGPLEPTSEHSGGSVANLENVDRPADSTVFHGAEDQQPCSRLAAAQHFSFVLLTACLLIFFGLMGGLAKLPDGRIIKLAFCATGIAAFGIYTRGALLAVGRSFINGVARNNDR